MEDMTVDKQKLKIHKQLLKDEVLKQRKQLNELDRYAQGKTMALKSLSDFFQNQTLSKVDQIRHTRSFSKNSFEGASSEGEGSITSRSEKSHKSNN